MFLQMEIRQRDVLGVICKLDYMRVCGPRILKPSFSNNGGKVRIPSPPPLISASWRRRVVFGVCVLIWVGALYENEYVKEDGVWKIKVLRYRPQWHATFEKGMSV